MRKYSVVLGVLLAASLIFSACPTKFKPINDDSLQISSIKKSVLDEGTIPLPGWYESGKTKAYAAKTYAGLWNDFNSVVLSANTLKGTTVAKHLGFGETFPVGEEFVVGFQLVDDGKIKKSTAFKVKVISSDSFYVEITESKLVYAFGKWFVKVTIKNPTTPTTPTTTPPKTTSKPQATLRAKISIGGEGKTVLVTDEKGIKGEVVSDGGNPAKYTTHFICPVDEKLIAKDIPLHAKIELTDVEDDDFKSKGASFFSLTKVDPTKNENAWNLKLYKEGPEATTTEKGKDNFLLSLINTDAEKAEEIQEAAVRLYFENVGESYLKKIWENADVDSSYRVVYSTVAPTDGMFPADAIVNDTFEKKNWGIDSDGKKDYKNYFALALEYGKTYYLQVQLTARILAKDAVTTEKKEEHKSPIVVVKTRPNDNFAWNVYAKGKTVGTTHVKHYLGADAAEVTVEKADKLNTTLVWNHVSKDDLNIHDNNAYSGQKYVVKYWSKDDKSDVKEVENDPLGSSDKTVTATLKELAFETKYYVEIGIVYQNDKKHAVVADVKSPVLAFKTPKNVNNDKFWKIESENIIDASSALLFKDKPESRTVSTLTPKIKWEDMKERLGIDDSDDYSGHSYDILLADKAEDLADPAKAKIVIKKHTSGSALPEGKLEYGKAYYMQLRLNYTVKKTEEKKSYLSPVLGFTTPKGLESVLFDFNSEKTTIQSAKYFDGEAENTPASLQHSGAVDTGKKWLKLANSKGIATYSTSEADFYKTGTFTFDMQYDFFNNTVVDAIKAIGYDLITEDDKNANTGLAYTLSSPETVVSFAALRGASGSGADIAGVSIGYQKPVIKLNKKSADLGGLADGDKVSVKITKGSFVLMGADTATPARFGGEVDVLTNGCTAIGEMEWKDLKALLMINRNVEYLPPDTWYAPTKVTVAFNTADSDTFTISVGNSKAVSNLKANNLYLKKYGYKQFTMTMGNKGFAMCVNNVKYTVTK